MKFPPYQIRTLANGLQVIAVAHHEQPAVSLRLIIRAGGAQDPADKSGVATLVAALLDQGTTTRDAEQIATAIDSIGGLVGTGAGSDLSFINAVVMKDSFAFGLDMVSDLARNPKFAPEELERQRQQILSGLKVGYEDPDYIAGMVFDRLVYGFHPYGRPDSGTPESISSITRDDLVAFHKAWFGANNAILAIVGDISARGGVCRRRACVRQVGAGPSRRRRSRLIRRRRPGVSSSSIGQVRSRPRFASATSAFRAGTRTILRSISRSTSSAAKAATGCTACCAPIAA